MKSIQIKRDGKLWKLAEQGGMRPDGQVFSKSAEKYNELLRDRYLSSDMKSDDYDAQRQQLYNDIDFCAFARRVVWGATKFVVGFLFAAAMLSFMAAPLLSLIWWGVTGFHGSFRDAGVLPCIGLVECIFSAVVVAFVLTRDWLRNQPRKAKPAPKVEDIAAKLNKMEVRRAFYAAIKGKTCTKVEFTE